MSAHWKDWCWSWNSNTLATWCEELTHLKRPWCWERLKAGERDNRGWDGWMASPTQWTSLSKLRKTSDEQEGLECCSPWGRKESDSPEQLNWSCFSHIWLFATLWTVTCQAPLSMGLSSQEYWRGLPCSPPGDLLDPGIEPLSLISPGLPEGSLPLALPLLKMNEILSPHKVLYTNIYTILIHNCPKLQTIQCPSVTKWINYGTFLPWHTTQQ